MVQVSTLLELEGPIAVVAVQLVVGRPLSRAAGVPAAERHVPQAASGRKRADAAHVVAQVGLAPLRRRREARRVWVLDPDVLVVGADARRLLLGGRLAGHALGAVVADDEQAEPGPQDALRQLAATRPFGRATSSAEPETVDVLPQQRPATLAVSLEGPAEDAGRPKIPRAARAVPAGVAVAQGC